MIYFYFDEVRYDIQAPPPPPPGIPLDPKRKTPQSDPSILNRKGGKVKNPLFNKGRKR